MAKTCFLGSIYDEAERRANEPVYAAPVMPEGPAAAGEIPPEAAPKASVKFCKHCGSPLPEEAMFCSNCGLSQALDSASVKEAAAEVKEKAEEIAEGAKEKAEEIAEETKEKAAEFAEEAKEKAAEVKEEVKKLA